MLIREHYARNEIKWQHEVVCLSLNWVFLAGEHPTPVFFPWVLHSDQLNVISGCVVLCPSVCDLYSYFGTNVKIWRIKSCVFQDNRYIQTVPFRPAGCRRRQWVLWARLVRDSDDLYSYSSVLGSFYPAPPCLAPRAWKRGLSSKHVGAARITKVKDYLHMVFLTRKREVLWRDSSLMWGLINRERLQKTITG